jgi:VWFA-related protein
MNKNKLSGLLVAAVLLSVLAIGISVSAQADDDVAPPTLELLVTPDEGVSTSSFDYTALPAAVQTVITDPNEGKKIDIKEVNADLSPTASPTDLTVNVVFYTPVTSETLTYTWFDLDENPSTGAKASDYPGYGLNDIGADLAMEVYNGYSNAYIFDPLTGVVTGILAISWTSNSFTVVIPLSMLGNDDGCMNVTQFASELGMYLVDCDAAPNQGHGRVNCTSNCTLVISQITPLCNPRTIEAIVAVTDPQGPVAGLTESDFTVKENGNAISPITVTPLSATQKPMDVALTLDGSGSMSSTDKTNAKAAANVFVNLMSTSDRGAVVGFAENIIVKEHLTSDKAKLHDAINTYETGLDTGATSLYDAIVVSVDEVASSTNVRAVLVMTDGKNNYGSHTMQSAIDHANKYSVPVYTIGIGSADQSVLQQIAAQTGGKYYYAPSSSELTQIYQELAEHIYSQYLITWDTIFTGSPATINVEIAVSCGGSDISTYPVCGPHTPPCVVWIDNVSTSPSGTPTEPIMLDVTDFGSATIELTYDPTIVQVQSVSQGDCGAVFENIDNANGKTIISSQGTGAMPGPSGTLEFAKIGFKAVGSVGECSPLNLNVVTLAHSTGMPIIPATACDGKFCITQTCRICGDVNCDCQVNIVDAMFIAQYTVGNRQTPCDPCPDPYPCACGGDGGPLSGSP